MKDDPPKEWRDANRENWDKRVSVHLAASAYDLTLLRKGKGQLFPIDEAILPDVKGKKVLHLQCHFGRDSLAIAQKGATVTGVDFSEPAIATARQIATELGLDDKATFVVSDVYEARNNLPDHAYDVVYTTWGTIGWLPDIKGWAETVAHFLKPGGDLVFADSHPTALIFDDEARDENGHPGWFLPYFFNDTFIDEDTSDYTGNHPVIPGTTYEWMHKVSDVVGALISAGLVIEDLREYDAAVWPMFSCLRQGRDGLYRWPGKPWLPLSWSIRARRPV